MPHRRWAERVDFELARRGVPARFRRRLLAELRDHADDLTDEEGLIMTDDVCDGRLGRPAELAAAAAAEYRRATWVARHPLFVFGLLPVPATVVMFIATVVLLELTAYGIGSVFMGGFEDMPRSATVAFAYALAWAVRFVPFVVLAFVFTRLYLRHAVNRWWFATAAAQVLVFAGTFISTILYSDVPGQSAWMMGFAWIAFPTPDGWVWPFLAAVGWPQVLQVLVPAAVGG